MSDKLVSIITATTGNDLLADALKSVNNQTHNRIQHLVFVDGKDRKEKAEEIINSVTPSNNVEREVIYLPYSIGKDRWNGHRMYGAGTFIADGDYLMFLDDDNYLEPTHIDDCLKAIDGYKWACSFRRIVDKERNFICNDDCESLGKWPSVLGDHDYFIDVNCYFLSRQAAVNMVSVWYRKFREPGVMEIDRAMIQVLKKMYPDFGHTKNYTVNYTVGNTEHSVKGEFFLKGNNVMLQRHAGVLPWKLNDNEYILKF